MQRLTRPQTEAINSLVLLIGVVVVFFGATNFVQAKQSSRQDAPVSPILKERQLAIEKAKAEDRAEYSFTTSFIPGVGYIGSPSDYKQELGDSLRLNLK